MKSVQSVKITIILKQACKKRGVLKVLIQLLYTIVI